ncbi:MAG: isoprenylcysteine carboxylmethyltransferase family protein [Bacteroidota bacterium]|nr:isoprenylcysteine carboxylmethyltransferase family protein [Bacteroidota bacterium]
MLIFANANIYSMAIGLAIAVVGELIRLWGVSWAGSETRTTDVGGTFLIISGPFAYVRNPLYVGNILMYTGLGIMSYALFPYLQIAGLVFFVTQYYFIVSKEEEYLRGQFGVPYAEYTKNVNRFFPKLSAFRSKESVKQPPFNLQAGLRSERRTFQAFGFVALALIVEYIVFALNAK